MQVTGGNLYSKNYYQPHESALFPHHLQEMVNANVANVIATKATRALLANVKCLRRAVEP